MNFSPTVVVNLLSPSPIASRRSMQRIAASTGNKWSDELAQYTVLDALSERPVLSSPKIDVVALRIPGNVVLQWLSIEKNATTRKGKLQVHSIQTLATKHATAMQETRKCITQHRSSWTMLRRLKSLLRQTMIEDILPLHGNCLPYLNMGDCSSDPSIEAAGRFLPGQLKEIVLPIWSDSKYEDGRTLFSTLSESPYLSRPVPGIYQLRSAGLCIRPLPMASEDRILPPPSLIFHSDIPQLRCTNIEDESTVVVKIGHTGRKGDGQYMLLDKEISSDIRICSALKPNSAFAESQESLMASSLLELQSTSVMSSNPVQDPRMNAEDCWNEFRANLKNPSGFFRKTRSRSASAPNIPYE